MSPSDTITSVLQESRLFPPSKEFQSKASLSSREEYEAIWERAKDDPEGFWAEKARTLIGWDKPFTKTLSWDPPHAKWFEDGTLNAATNCLDRHLETRAHKPAIIWEGEPGEERTLTFTQLHALVCQTAHALKELGIGSGDRVTIYMPMIPEAVAAMLACARLGAVHTVVFGGFSAEALAERNNDAGSKLVITADGGYRRGEFLALKTRVDESLPHSPTVKNVLVFQRGKERPQLVSGRDVLWQDFVPKMPTTHEPESFPSEHPLFILYTSGSTGKPKGILHTTAGYLLGTAYSFQTVFDWKEHDVYWCTADVGWVTGHSYIVYGPLATGATVMMYEGAPNHPDPSRFWKIIEKYKVSIFYTAPTAIRAFMKWGDEHVRTHDLSSLRLLGTVGEPINPAAWLWFHEMVGAKRCPIVDTWWQTETGCIMISPLPGVTATAPGSATMPFFGIVPSIVDKKGIPVPRGQGGSLVIEKPWPSMARTIHGNPDRFQAAYWSTFPGRYFTGDGARQDENGYFWILGRMDDVLNVSGHRLSTMEVESALVHHPKVAEAAVVGRPDELKGEAICCFVTLRNGEPTEALKKELKDHVVKTIGALARPEDIRFTESLPKTRSGKIMRRLLRDIARGQESKGDMTTLEDFTVMEKLRQDEED